MISSFVKSMKFAMAYEAHLTYRTLKVSGSAYWKYCPKFGFVGVHVCWDWANLLVIYRLFGDQDGYRRATPSHGIRRVKNEIRKNLRLSCVYHSVLYTIRTFAVQPMMESEDFVTQIAMEVQLYSPQSCTAPLMWHWRILGREMLRFPKISSLLPGWLWF